MNTQKLEIEFPSYVLQAIHKSRKKLIQQMKVLTAINLYRSGELSLEMAAEFSGKSKWEFEDLLSKNEIPISLVNFDDYTRELGYQM